MTMMLPLAAPSTSAAAPALDDQDERLLVSPPLSSFTSTTAPGKIFHSRSELAQHYQSDWHKYNLKRREAGLPVVLQSDFQARFEAAQALRHETSNKTNHLKKKNSKQHHRKDRTQSQRKDAKKVVAGTDDTIRPSTEDTPSTKPDEVENGVDDTAAIPPVDSNVAATATEQATDDAEEKEIDINPRQCLFDRHVSASVQSNVDRMQFKYGFFVPDMEYLHDLEGLIGYCHEKIKLGHACLWCQRIFATWHGCQTHMISKRHTKLLYQPNVDLEDLSVFYDFSQADHEFLTRLAKVGTTRAVTDSVHDDNADTVEEENHQEGEDDDNDDEWEDISDDDEPKDDDDDIMEELEFEDDTNVLELYQDEVARMGLDVTPLGEIVFPDGRIVGHRTWRRYYQQRLPSKPSSTAVLAAKSAASERLYRGQVYRLPSSSSDSVSRQPPVMRSSFRSGWNAAVASGRRGQGILVSSRGSGSYDYSALSWYRYRAAIRKEQIGEQRGRRLYEKSNQNMNRMDKKANRLMNGVSVAHAAR